MLNFDADPPAPVCENCAGLTFAEEQGSFLVGAAAAMNSESGTLGFIGGVGGFGLIEKFEAGFAAGAKAVNPDITIIPQYITMAPDFDGFVAPDRAREIALAMYDQGADVVYHAAGGSGAGLFEAAAERSESGGSKVWAIGVDSDQYLTAAPEVQEYILTSMLKQVNTAVFEITKAQQDGSFAAGNTVYDLSVDGVGYSTSGDFLTAEQITTLEDFKAQIIDGTIVVPTAPEG
jgi:basic membrane protein A